ncbi:MAG TPA: hypothetical protein VFC13_21225, partial [Actinomycetes bacterium]|nr:hypothetical protein [Actinomycetes bacterium]
MTSSLTELRPPPTFPPAPPPTPTRPTRSTAWYWVAGILAVLGLTAAVAWGAVGTINTLDRVDDYDRVTVPGAMTVAVTDPGTVVVYYESPAEFARYADPTATGRTATRWNPATDATIVVPYIAGTPTWQQLRLTVTGPDGAAVPVSTYRSMARYDVDPGRLGRAVASFEASTVGQYRVSAARAVETGGTLAIGDDFPRSIVMAVVQAAILGLVAVLAAVLLA